MTRYADDWVITCKTAQEARAALEAAKKALKALSVEINPEKTRIVHVSRGVNFLGFQIKRANRTLRWPGKIKRSLHAGGLYAYPTKKSLERFQDRIRVLTRRRAPVTTERMVTEINPLIRGWGEYYKRAHVRRLFHRLDVWIIRRLWAHRFKRWRCPGWTVLPAVKVYEELGLEPLLARIPSIAARRRAPS